MKGPEKLIENGEYDKRRNFNQHQYRRNLQRIFQQESSFKFPVLGSYDEEKELLSPIVSELDEVSGDDLAQEKGRKKSEDFRIIELDLKQQPKNVTNIVLPTRSLERKHFSSSPYKVLTNKQFHVLSHFLGLYEATQG